MSEEPPQGQRRLLIEKLGNATSRVREWAAEIFYACRDADRRFRIRSICVGLLKWILLAAASFYLGVVHWPWNQPHRPAWIDGASAFVDERPLLVVLIVAIPVIIAPLLGRLQARFRKAVEDRDVASANVFEVLDALDHFVGEKYRRFGKCVKSINNSSRPASEIFLEITRPDLQIESIAERLYFLLCNRTGDTGLKMAVVELSGKDGEPLCVANFPPGKPPPDELLGDPVWKRTFFHHVTKQRTEVVISDIARHLRRRRSDRHYEGQNDGADVGSIIGIPVVHEYLGWCIFVITIKSDRPFAIGRKFKKQYKKIISHFTIRLKLEYSLKLLRHAAK